MPKVIVIYDSRTGFTEKMAEAVSEGAKEVGVEVEVLKVGTPFSISKLDEAHAIILGSPTIYGSVTPEMRSFLEALSDLTKSKKLKLFNKVGGVFGSYGWDGGWVVEKLNKDLEVLGIKVFVTPVSLVHELYEKVRLDAEALQKCRELGKMVATKVADK